LAVEPLCREGDAKLLLLPFDGGKIRARPRRGGIGITDLGTGGGIECGRGVPHAAAYHMLGDETATKVAEHGPERIASARRLEADEAAARGRDAGRTTAVIGMRERNDAGCHRCRRSARRTAGRISKVPTISRGPVALR